MATAFSEPSRLALAIKSSPCKPLVQRAGAKLGSFSPCEDVGSAARTTLSVPRRLRRSDASEHTVPAVTRGRPEPGGAPVQRKNNGGRPPVSPCGRAGVWTASGAAEAIERSRL